MKSANSVRFWRFRALFAVLGALVWCGGCAVTGHGEQAVQSVSLERGLIKGAHFTLAVPAQWNGNLLVIAHGFRPESGQRLAHLDPSEPYVAELLAQGWLVATTSYRRNGLIIADAQDDLQRLIGAVVRKYGPCRQIIVEGSSMGANIAVLMAEQTGVPDTQSKWSFTISGVIALGAAPASDGEDGGPQVWAHAPQLPVLFVSNRTEIADVQDYVRGVRRGRDQPAVWLLDRDGHVNINTAERLAAVVAMSAWAAPGGRWPEGTALSPWDVTVDFSARNSVAEPISRKVKQARAGWVDMEGWAGRVVAVDPVYGNIETDLVAADLVDLGVQPGQRIRVTCGEVHRSAVWGTTYRDVEKGQFVVFVTANGTLRVARNLGNAARGLRCHAGEKIEMTSWIDIIDSATDIDSEPVPRY